MHRKFKPALENIDESKLHMGLLDLHCQPAGDDPRKIEIRYQDDEYKPGRLLATLTAAEGVSDKAVLVMAEFFACAPELWRLLRKDTQNRFLAFHGLYVEPEIEMRWEALCKSSDRIPFDPPENHCDDEIVKSEMRKLLGTTETAPTPTPAKPPRRSRRK